jgi:hypothetical protein
MAIERAAVRLEWVPRRPTPTTFELTRTRGSLVVVVVIVFDEKSIAVAYARSENLAYSATKGTIDGTYNRWVSALAKAIREEIGKATPVEVRSETQIEDRSPSTSVAQTPPPAPEPTSSSTLPQQRLLLFGGEVGHHVFLGCLTCKSFDIDSVCSTFGEYGSRFSPTSIWNRFGEYGSRFSPLSPWNRFASTPPVVVDAEGRFYGYFTSASHHASRTSVPFFLTLLDNPEKVNDDLQAARDAFCGN